LEMELLFVPLHLQYCSNMFNFQFFSLFLYINRGSKILSTLVHVIHFFVSRTKCIKRSRVCFIYSDRSYHTGSFQKFLYINHGSKIISTLVHVIHFFVSRTICIKRSRVCFIYSDTVIPYGILPEKKTDMTPSSAIVVGTGVGSARPTRSCGRASAFGESAGACASP
jgi:hypothetical protein